MNNVVRMTSIAIAGVLGVGLLGASACGPNMNTIGVDLRHRLLLLEQGLTRDSVDKIMGTDSVRVTAAVYEPQMVASPFRTESFETGGAEWDVLYYLTFPRNSNGTIEDDELTPLVLEDDILQGWGWEFLYGVMGMSAAPAAGDDAAGDTG